jgi:phage gpG-like protein
VPITAKVEDGQLRVDLGQLRAAVSTPGPLLGIAGEVMRGSIAHTFRDEGSPAGSWPRLALSTLRRKGYTAGHKLLILSGRLFRSISYIVTGNVLTIGTDVPYGAVHQFGSADRGSGEGPQARVSGRDVRVREHNAMRTFKQRMGKDGVVRTVRTRQDKSTNVHVSEHRRFQNIPARPYLVFRPEDPGRIVEAFQEYLGTRVVAMRGAR